MRTCRTDNGKGCGRTSEETEFYESEKQNILCKACINRIRLTRRGVCADTVTRAERAHDAILTVAQQFQSEVGSLVYLLDSGLAYKIGVTTSIVARVRALQTAHASKYPIRVLAVVPGKRELEQQLHEQFAAFNLAREWFRRKDDIVKAFSELSNSMVFLPKYLSQEAPRR